MYCSNDRFSCNVLLLSIGNIFEEPLDSRPDTVNNVEVVFIKEPVKGKYTIDVIGANSMEQVQDFVIVYSGEIS
jgi:hypothetical protein